MTNPQYGGLLDAITEALRRSPVARRWTSRRNWIARLSRLAWFSINQRSRSPNLTSKQCRCKPRHHLAAARALSRSATTRWKKALS